jgi:hypothetical protein
MCALNSRARAMPLFNSSLQTVIGTHANEATWRTAVASAFATPSILELRLDDVVMRSYAVGAFTIVGGAAGSGGIKSGPVSNCAVFALACDFSVGNWTYKITNGSYEIAGPVSEIVPSGNLAAGQQLMWIGPAFLFRDPAAFGIGGSVFPVGLQSDFTALWVPNVGDYELRQPLIVSDATVSIVPETGALYYVNSSVETLLNAGQILTPAQFKTVFYRAPVAISVGASGGFEYVVNGVTKRVSIERKNWQTMHGVQKSRLRLFDAATSGNQLFEQTVDFTIAPNDLLGNFKRGPLPSSVEGIGYQYCTTSPEIIVTTPAAKAGYKVFAQRWFTPSKNEVEIKFDGFPLNKQFPLRTENGALSLAVDDWQLLNVEIDLLDANGNVYAAVNERAGRLRGTTNGSDETRITLTAGQACWWWNKKPDIINFANNPRLIYPHRLGSDKDTLNTYNQTNASAIDGQKPNVFVDGKWGARGWGYKTPGYSGALCKVTWGGGGTHDRQPYHEAESAVLSWGPSAVKPYTINGSENYGEMMLNVADCAANGIPCVWQTEPNAGPFDAARYPASYLNMALTDASPFGAISHNQWATGGFPLPPVGTFSLQNAQMSGWQMDQAHFYTAVGATYALTGCVRYLMTQQFAVMSILLTVNPGYRNGPVIGQGFDVFYRSWNRPMTELYKAAIFAPEYADGMWIDKTRLKQIYTDSWVQADAILAADEASTNPNYRVASTLGLRLTGLRAEANNFGEGVAAVNDPENIAQVGWPTKPAGSNVYGWFGGVWDICYVTALLLMMKKMGDITTFQDRYIKRLARFVQGAGAYVQSAAENHPWIVVDRITAPPNTSGSLDWNPYDDTSSGLANVFNSGAVPANGGYLGSAALGGVEYTTWEQIRVRRSEVNRAATGYINGRQSRNFSFYLYWEFAEAFEREFSNLKGTDFPDWPIALDYYRRSMGKIKEAMSAAQAQWTPSDFPFQLAARRGMTNPDPLINDLEGALFLSYGHLYLSTVPTLASPKVWQASGVDA